MQLPLVSPPKISGNKSIGKWEKLKRLLEDRFICEQILTKGGLSIGLGIIADGIGGENAGEVAAELTAENIYQFCKESTDTNIPEMLKTALTKLIP